MSELSVRGASSRLPDFLVIGAPRCATTSLHYYLDQHPALAMSATKEPGYFLFDAHGRPFVAEPPIVTKSTADRDRYARLFAGAEPHQRAGEASPLYLYPRECPTRIAEVLDRPRLIAVLRNPIDRAFSHHVYTSHLPPERLVAEFMDLVRAEAGRLHDHEPYRTRTHLLRLGIYAPQLERYVAEFGPESLLVVIYEDLVDDPGRELDRICRHLSVDADWRFDTSIAFNPSSVAGARLPSRLAARLRSAVQPRLKRILPPSVTRRLARYRATRPADEGAPQLEGPERERVRDLLAPSVGQLASLGYPTGRWTDFHR